MQELRSRLACLMCAACVFGVACDACVAAPATEPLRLAVAAHYGWGVEAGSGSSTCDQYSGECVPARPSTGPGGFRYLAGVAADPSSGDLVVADTANDRVQRLSPTGQFISAFGGRQPDGGAGSRPSAPMRSPSAVAIEPDSGDVYVLEASRADMRVDRYTPAGRLLWTAGLGVNESTGGGLCEPALEGGSAGCGIGKAAPVDEIAPYAFKFAQYEGNLLAFGGAGHLLYVGDEHRVQEFDSAGRPRGQLLLASLGGARGDAVLALALDEAGDLFVVYGEPENNDGAKRATGERIYEFDPRRTLRGSIVIAPNTAGSAVEVTGLASDGHGRLAVIGGEATASGFVRFGDLYDVASRALTATFAPPGDSDGIAFGANDYLYVAATDDQEVTAYSPEPAQQLLSGPTRCEPAAAGDRAAALNCALQIWQ